MNLIILGAPGSGKGTEEWFDDVKAFCDEVEWNHIPREDIRIEKNNRLILRKADIEKAIKWKNLK